MRSSVEQVSRPVGGLKLTNDEFQKVRKIIHGYSGIFIQEGKEALVQSRLMKRVRKLGLSSFKEYLNYVDSDSSGEEFLALVDVITTNKTNFFREAKHFDFIESRVLPELRGRSVKWWNAGCSTGEEPITTAITLLEAKQHTGWGSVKILATDLSRDVLEVAKQGVYPASKMAGVPQDILRKYFSHDNGHFHVSNEIRKMITYGRLNLMDRWPLKGPFNVIMCRNVMIYFNRQTQQELVAKFHQLLEPGGYLFLGHSESIPKENRSFVNLAPAVYQKR
ncbi:CheR family methyltransferase [Gracilimonas mengyeensis]|uniref:protein-glutamate O-methyltransferase n=1 Tax=Gracilimonas mengyeensis TaxID=1302730 RepID=A0A521D735_9BACT|nr:protein-glutamate O-methyltransferase [Gracilimonas mengyeensis]SMO67508.1 chemotaxis protein methyltransferase CheR [Gracilimonas mengyeensis]